MSKEGAENSTLVALFGHWHQTNGSTTATLSGTSEWEFIKGLTLWSWTRIPQRITAVGVSGAIRPVGFLDVGQAAFAVVDE